MSATKHRLPKRPTREEWAVICKTVGNAGPSDNISDTLFHLLQSHRSICENLRRCREKFNLGNEGERLDVVVVNEIERLHKPL